MNTPIVIMGASGRMGSTVARLVTSSDDLTLVGCIDRKEQLQSLKHLNVPATDNAEELLPQCPNAVIVNFTAPAATIALLDTAVRYKNPMVIGTTGFSDEQTKSIENAAKQIPLLLSANMSPGVNALLDILPRLCRMLGETYDIDITEMHHKHKKDAPSGTALRLAECLAKARQWNTKSVLRSCREGITGERPKEEIGMQVLRGGDVTGVHTVYFMGEGERIEVTHHAHSRETFAVGALRAARWLAKQKPGSLYTIKNVLEDEPTCSM